MLYFVTPPYMKVELCVSKIGASEISWQNPIMGTNREICRMGDRITSKNGEWNIRALGIWVPIETPIDKTGGSKSKLGNNSLHWKLRLMIILGKSRNKN